METGLADSVMQVIVGEDNLAEMTFFVPTASEVHSDGE